MASTPEPERLDDASVCLWCQLNTKKRGEPLLAPPFVNDSRMLDLELISPVQIAVCPASTAPGSAVVLNPEVSLYSRGQIARVIPQQAPTDAHPRRDEVPQIPLSDYISTTVELTTIDRRDYISRCKTRESAQSVYPPGSIPVYSPSRSRNPWGSTDTDRDRSTNHSHASCPVAQQPRQEE